MCHSLSLAQINRLSLNVNLNLNKKSWTDLYCLFGITLLVDGFSQLAAGLQSQCITCSGQAHFGLQILSDDKSKSVYYYMLERGRERE